MDNLSLNLRNWPIYIHGIDALRVWQILKRHTLLKICWLQILSENRIWRRTHKLCLVNLILISVSSIKLILRSQILNIFSLLFDKMEIFLFILSQLWVKNLLDFLNLLLHILLHKFYLLNLRLLSFIEINFPFKK